jgi:epoxyqueuosine reductase
MIGIKDTIKAEVKNLGFSLAGFTTPGPLSSYSIYRNWVNAGYYGEMNYLARADALQKRADPGILVPEAKTIIVLAAAYPSPDITASSNPANPIIAAYAQLAEDYHLAFKKACHQVEVILKELYESNQLEKCGENLITRSFSDTTPILEKALAQKAGLGWIGKNGCFINEEFGSWLLLAEVFTNLIIEPDPPFEENFCGNCTRCISACPTQCILPNRTLEARKCISYLTIEHHSEISREYRTMIKNNIFGCDACQVACPWNQKAEPDAGSLLQSSGEIAFPETWRQTLEMDDDGFIRVFKNTPLKRLHVDRWLRNSLVAAANSNDQHLLPIVLDILHHHPSPMVRSHAAWAVQQLAGVTANSLLIQAVEREKDETVRSSIQELLADIS